jgi:hypothetical protein
MKKTLSYILALVALIGVAVFLFFKNQAPSIEEQRDFTTAEIGELSQINLKDRHGHEVVLTKENNIWMANERYPASRVMLNDLLYALEFMYAEYPVPAVAVNNVLTEMITNSTKVSLYKNGKSKPFKVFSVGGASHAQDGSFMLMNINGEAAEKPYLVKLPGFRGYITYRFSSILKYWVSQDFTSYLPQEIESVSLEYFQEDKDESFTLKRADDTFELTSNGQTYLGESLNTDLAEGLFASFMELSFEDFMDSIPNKDSIVANLHLLDIRVNAVDGKKHHLSIYTKPLNIFDNAPLDQDGNPVYIDPLKLYAYNHQSESFFTIQYFTFGKVFLKATQLQQ